MIAIFGINWYIERSRDTLKEVEIRIYDICYISVIVKGNYKFSLESLLRTRAICRHQGTQCIGKSRSSHERHRDWQIRWGWGHLPDRWHTLHTDSWQTRDRGAAETMELDATCHPNVWWCSSVMSAMFECVAPRPGLTPDTGGPRPQPALAVAS